MAPAAASGGSSLPSGFSVFVSFPDLLFIFEFVSSSAPCAGKGMGWVMLLAPSKAPHCCPGHTRSTEGGKPGNSPHLSVVPFSNSGSICRQVQRNFFPELWSYPTECSFLTRYPAFSTQSLSK